MRFLSLAVIAFPLNAVIVENLAFNDEPRRHSAQQEDSSNSEFQNPYLSPVTESYTDNEIMVLTQSVNAVLEGITQLSRDQSSLSERIEQLEVHQREFMGYIHESLMATNENTPSEQYIQDYDTGVTLMQQNKMDAALKHWQHFIEQYPASGKVPAAYYWIGEIYYVRQQDDLAKDAYMYLIDNYPDFEKSSDALYKLGQILFNQGSVAQARQYWGQVIKNYPQSSIAKLAKQQMSQTHTDNS